MCPRSISPANFVIARHESGAAPLPGVQLQFTCKPPSICIIALRTTSIYLILSTTLPTTTTDLKTHELQARSLTSTSSYNGCMSPLLVPASGFAATSSIQTMKIPKKHADIVCIARFEVGSGPGRCGGRGELRSSRTAARAAGTTASGWLCKSKYQACDLLVTRTSLQPSKCFLF
jgi:hypothetical protein